MLAASISLPALAQSSSTTTGPSTAQEPATPTKEDLKNVGKQRGIMIEPIRSIKPATTEEKKSASTPKSSSTVKTATSSPKTTAKTDQTRTANATVPAKKNNIKNVSTKVVLPVVKTADISVPTVKHTPKTINVNHHPVVASHTQSTTVASGDSIVTASLNKVGNAPHYKDGEKLRVNVAAQKDCNLMIFNYDGNMLTQLFPNDYQTSPYVKAGQTVEIGGEQSKFDFQASNDKNKASREKIFVYAYPVESDSAPISVAMNPIPETPFRGTEFTPEQYRELVNQAKVFAPRSVKVMGKAQTQLVSYTVPTSQSALAQGPTPNKVELSLVIDGKN